MHKDKAMALVAALRSGKYRQTMDALHRDNNTYCCLGVACAISGVGTWGVSDSRGLISYVCGQDDTAIYDSSELPDPVCRHYDFHSTVGSRKDGRDLVIDNQKYDCIAVANDAGVTFEKIADYIEQNWEHL